MRGHNNFLEQPGDDLRRDRVAAVGEQLDRGPVRTVAERNRIFAEAVRDDERHRRGAGFHGGFRRRGRVVRLLHAFLFGRRPWHDRQRSFALRPRISLCDCAAVIFIHHQQTYLGHGVAAPAEDHGKDGEEPYRQDEAQRQSAAVAAQARSALYVQWRISIA